MGVQGFNTKTTIDPASTRSLATLVESLGYRSWWASEHVVLPSPRVDPSPADPTEPLLDPLVHLSYVAAVTSRLELGTGILILPQRNPLVLAKQAASLDVLSGGRFVLGVGAGYLEPELSAVGVPLADRGGRTDEYLDAMNALWHSPAPSFSGKYVSFSGVDAHPRPSGIRVVVGGHSAGALKRAVSRGHGWLGIGSPADIAGHLDRLRALSSTVERPASLGPLEINAIPLTSLDASLVRQYEDLGVSQLVINPPMIPGSVEEVLESNAGFIG
ncbi:LLM class F420-dependent oxidoreductase [Lentzea sp. NBRC 105346]|uniref:LLM class F420-dependent oxidoreductase n=1 Tax=Lentzea sp. NBRC 105346 TaxID=3032205 RepID=UPI0025572B95|nr:LLM class F420-dependent oxidoreductase [Lentzea sp. NBRC 105346]